MPIKYEEADVIPWHGWEGGGKQAKFEIDGVNNWKELIKDKVVDIEIISSPNSSFELTKDGKLFYK